MDLEIAPASPSSSSSNNNNSSAPSTPKSSRLSRKAFKTRSPSVRRTRVNPRWEGQENVPVFDLLPDELVIRIHTYLDVPTIGLTAQISNRFNEVFILLVIHIISPSLHKV